MFNLAIIIITKAIKVFGITSAVSDIYFSLFDAMGINLTLLFYTLAIEGLFIYLKTSRFKLPVWVEVVEDLI